MIGRAKDWLKCIPNRTIQTWKELEDKFLERYYSNAQFVGREAAITNFSQDGIEFLSDAWERFKQLLRKFPMDQLSHFMRGLTTLPEFLLMPHLEVL